MTKRFEVCWFCKKTVSEWDVQTSEAWCFLIGEAYIYVHRDCVNKFVREHIVKRIKTTTNKPKVNRSA